MTKEERNDRRPVNPSYIAFAGLVAAVGRGRADVESVGRVLIVGVMDVRLISIAQYSEQRERKMQEEEFGKNDQLHRETTVLTN